MLILLIFVLLVGTKCVNQEGKIINSGDFGDATGLVMAVAPDQTE